MSRIASESLPGTVFRLRRKTITISGRSVFQYFHVEIQRKMYYNGTIQKRKTGFSFPEVFGEGSPVIFVLIRKGKMVILEGGQRGTLRKGRRFCERK